MIENANAALMFLLEIAVYVSVAMWAVTVGSGTALHVILAIVAIGIFAGVWALFGAPKAPLPLHGFGRTVLEIVWFGAAAAALAAAGHPVLAVVFAAVFVLNAGVRWYFSRARSLPA